MSLLTGILQQQSNGTTLKNGLVSVWEFEETSGTIAYDAYGTNNINITPSVVIGNSGTVLNKNYYFGGSTAYYGNATSSIVDSSYSGLTVSIWLKAYNASSNEMICDNGNIFGNQNFFIYLNAGKPTFLVYGASTYNNYVSTSNISTSTWTSLICVWKSGEQVKIYRNGILETGGTAGGVVQTALKNALKNLYIAVRPGASLPLKANITQFSIWNKAVTESEIAMLYNSGNGLAYNNW